MSPAPNPSSPPGPSSPIHDRKRAHHHQTLSSLISRVFLSSDSRHEKQQSGRSTQMMPPLPPPPPSYAQQSGNAGANAETTLEAETDSAYRDLGIDPDQLTVFNIARDCGKSWIGTKSKTDGKVKGKTGNNALFSNSAAATTTADLSLSRGDEGIDAGDQSASVPVSPLPASSSSTLPPEHPHYPQSHRRSWRWNQKRSQRHKMAPSPSRFVEELLDNSATNDTGDQGKGKGRMSSADLDIDPQLPIVAPSRSPPPPPPKSPDPSEEHPTVSSLLRAREQVRLARRSLKESGDWLGVQGADPWTGEIDVLTPTNTVSTSSGSLPSASKIDNGGLMSAAGSARDVRSLLDSIRGRRRAAERACDRAREMEVRSREKMREAREEREAREQRDRAKLAKIKRRKEEEGWRVRREMMASGGSGSGGGGVRRWRQHRDQWSSIAEPNLSPIAQSICSSDANNINEPPPSSSTPPTSTVPNYSWPIQSPEVSRYGRTTSGNHQRSQSTDTIIHNHTKNKTSKQEPQIQTPPAEGQLPIVKAYSMSEKVQDPDPLNQTHPQQEEKHFLWRRRRPLTDPGGQDSKSPVIVSENIATPSETPTSTSQTQGADTKSPANHFTDLVIPDYHLHLLTPEPGEKPRTQLSTTEEALTPLSPKILDQSQIEENIQIKDYPTNGVTATSSRLRSKGLMRHHFIHRKPIASKPLGRLASRKEMAAMHIPLAPSRSLDTQRSYIDEELPRRNGLEVPPSEQQHLRLNPKNGVVHHSSSVDGIQQQQVRADSPSPRNAMEIDAMNHHNHGDELPSESENTEVSNASSQHMSNLPVPNGTSGKRFAFTPTTTITGCAHDHNQRQRQQGHGIGASEGKAPTPPPWALHAFQIDALLESNGSSSSNDDDPAPVTRTSSPSPSPPPPPHPTLTMTTTATTATATTGTTTTESENTTDDEDMMIQRSEKTKKKKEKASESETKTSSPRLRRISRPIPPRRSSLSFGEPPASASASAADLETRGRGRGIGIMSTQSTQSLNEGRDEKREVRRGISLPVPVKKKSVHFSEEGLVKAKMERTLSSSETVVERDLELQMVVPLETKGMECPLPLGHKENIPGKVEIAAGVEKGKKTGKVGIVPIMAQEFPVPPTSNKWNIGRLPNVVAKTNGAANGIIIPPSTHVTRIPVRPQRLSEHIDEVVREAGRTALIKGRAKQTTVKSKSDDHQCVTHRANSSEPEATTSLPDEVQRASHAHPQQSCNPARETASKVGATQVNSIDESKGEEVQKKEMAIQLEIHKKIEGEIQRQKRERRTIPTPIPPAPTYMPPPPPIDQQQVQQKKVLPPHHHQVENPQREGSETNNSSNNNHPPAPLCNREVHQKGDSEAIEEKKEEKKEMVVSARLQDPSEITAARQQLPLLPQEGGVLEGVGTGTHSRLPIPHIPSTDTRNIPSCRRAEPNATTTATAAAITAVREAQERSGDNSSSSSTSETLTKKPRTSSTTTTTTAVSRIPKIPTKPNPNPDNADRTKNKSSAEAIRTIIMTPALEFLKTTILLLAVVATAWFLVACMAFDRNSGFWRRRRAGRGSVVLDVAVLGLAGLFCGTVFVLAWYGSWILGWVGLRV